MPPQQFVVHAAAPQQFVPQATAPPQEFVPQATAHAQAGADLTGFLNAQPAFDAPPKAAKRRAMPKVGYWSFSAI